MDERGRPRRAPSLADVSDPPARPTIEVGECASCGTRRVLDVDSGLCGPCIRDASEVRPAEEEVADALDEVLREQDPREDPEERVIPRTLQVEVEDQVNDSFGLPPVWRCPCGGRPFEPDNCPRCGRNMTERWDA